MTMHIDQRWMFAVFACCALWVAGPVAMGAERFALNVDDVSGLDEPWPLIAGLPFPAGALKDASQICILNDGEPVPAQIDVVATWRDGSIRWAHAAFTASPQGDYGVAFGQGVTRSGPASPCTVRQADKGAVTVNTGAAVYEFEPNALLPSRATMGETTILAGDGEGAYLVDNRGRKARVSGADAEITTELHKRGPARVVVRREGWYVTAGGQRVARAKMWFYFAANSPFVRMTHTLVLTENTNEQWIRDYGLRFDTPQPAEEVAFALSEPVPSESLSYQAARPVLRDRRFDDFAHMFSGMHGRSWRTYTAKPRGDEVYMLQETYPHHFEREYRAVIGRVSPRRKAMINESTGQRDQLWLHDWEKETKVAGDWADARYGDHRLTVVTPWLAQRFPKEIAFGPEGARVALWSGRSARSLDFRPVTLVNEYWKKWGMAEHARRGGPGYSEARAAELAAMKVNAEGAARTHDVWLLPRKDDVDRQTLHARATAAARPPLVLAEPKWLAATEAIGWPMHHKDTERFPKVEQVIEEYWSQLMAGRSQLRPTGFIAWGRQPFIRGPNQHFRIGKMEEYYLRRNAWLLYARSGERRYYEYARRFNRFSGDYSVAHWTGGEGKVKGAFVAPYTGPPIYWGHGTKLWQGWSGMSVKHWLIGYYLTGDVYALDLTRMIGKAYKKHWDESHVEGHVSELGAYTGLVRLIDLYTREWDEDFKHMADVWADYLIDMDNPTGRSEISGNGVLYKGHRMLYALYQYHRWTGDGRAKQSFLKGLDYRYRFQRIPPPFTKNWSDFLYTAGYRMTGRPVYLSIVKHLIDQVRLAVQDKPRVHTYRAWHILGSVPTALGLLTEVDESRIGRYPVLKTDEPKPITFHKSVGKPVTLSIYVRMSEDVAADSDTVVQIAVQGEADGGRRVLQQGVNVEVERLIATKYEGRRDPRSRHVTIAVSSDAAAGEYVLRFPNIGRIVVLESNAPHIAWKAK